MESPSKTEPDASQADAACANVSEEACAEQTEEGSDPPMVELAFVHHPETVAYLQQNSFKIMFIMRGLPGSGKSTLASSIESTYGDVVICSADHYFTVNDAYYFDEDALALNHKKSEKKAQDACKSDKPFLVIDNCHVRYWEVKQYLQHAKDYGYLVVMAEPNTAWKMDPEQLGKRNCHGCPRSMIEKKLKQFGPIVPMYYGWFLGTRETDKLYAECVRYFEECLQVFKVWDAAFPKKHAIEQYQARCGTTKTLHCTARYVGPKQMQSDRVIQYAKSKTVTASMGQMSCLEVIGYVFTERTISARLRLNDHQLALWHQEAETRYTRPPSGKPDANFEALRSALTYSLPSGHGASAHITIGSRGKIEARQAGIDLTDLIRIESGSQPSCTVHEMDDAYLCYLARFGCAVYLKQPITCPSFFTGSY